ncbi:MAG TPA: class I SAM-dependent methyltransferase [Steroidobacteraceae bacterium]|nr:class I SAM-dependent methyltransferase [Steroidobacteraceae bacterium]
MTSVLKHYESHLAPIYLWMAGGLEHALSLGAADVAEFLDTRGYAVDLGAGFGMHCVPLARAGFRVLAIDTSCYLLEQLRGHCAGLDVTAVEADLRDFATHLSGPADLILCMGDTLTHLQSSEEVGRLFRAIASSLRPGGRFVATFRDYRELPLGDKRFIPVRSDSQRIHTCFLEQKPEHVLVHDIVHENGPDGWSMRVSSYEKLRLSPEHVRAAAEAAGLRCRCMPGPRGMLMIQAHT